MGGGGWHPASLSLFSHPDCPSLPIQLHSSPLPLTHWCQSDTFKQTSYVITFTVYLKKKKSSLGPSSFLCRPFRVEQTLHHLTYEVLPNQAQPLTQDSHYPSSQTHLCWASFCMGFLASHPCLSKYHPLFFKTLPASPAGDQTVKFFSVPFYSWSAFTESQ